MVAYAVLDPAKTKLAINADWAAPFRSAAISSLVLAWRGVVMVFRTACIFLRQAACSSPSLVVEFRLGDGVVIGEGDGRAGAQH
jgi:hypothetical protein